MSDCCGDPNCIFESDCCYDCNTYCTYSDECECIYECHNTRPENFNKDVNITYVRDKDIKYGSAEEQIPQIMMDIVFYCDYCNKHMLKVIERCNKCAIAIYCSNKCKRLHDHYCVKGIFMEIPSRSMLFDLIRQTDYTSFTSGVYLLGDVTISGVRKAFHYYFKFNVFKDALQNGALLSIKTAKDLLTVFTNPAYIEGVAKNMVVLLLYPSKVIVLSYPDDMNQLLGVMKS